MDPVNIPAKFEIRSFTRSWDNRGTSKSWGVPGFAHAPYSPKFLKGLLFAWTLWIYLPSLKFVALPVPEIIGGTQKIGQSLDMPTLPFLPNFSWAFVRMDPLKIPAKFEIRSFTRSWDDRGYSKNWAVPGFSQARYSLKFLMGFCSDGPSKCRSQIWSV